MYPIDVSEQVTFHKQQDKFNGCGAATAVMCRSSYPNPPVDVKQNKQAALFAKTQFYNGPEPVYWNTNPRGLAGCLNHLSNPAGIQWDVVALANVNPVLNGDPVLFAALSGMDGKGFPSAALVHGHHWVVVVGAETNSQPSAGVTTGLQKIRFYDPYPGTHNFITATTWYSSYWQAVSYAGTWNNKFVAIVEPPDVTGKVTVEMATRTGTTLLPADTAVAAALRTIKAEPLNRWPEYSVFFHPDVVNHPPMLVGEQAAGGPTEGVPHYYIVPFGLRGEFSERGGPVVRAVVMVNAYSGDFEEITAFDEPIGYLTREEAINVVAAAMQVESSTLMKNEAGLMFQSSGISQTSSYPFWWVKVGDRFLYVDQEGVLYGSIPPATPGG